MSDPSPEFRIAIVHANGGTTLDVAGEVDLATATELDTRLEAVMDASTGAVEIDLARVAFLDSSGLKVLLAAHRRLDAEGRRLTVRNPSALVFRVFKLSGVTAVLDVHSAGA